jgi:phage regulator Rha-like protein
MNYIDEMNKTVERIVQTVSSREVAEMMEVRHSDLLEKIEKINKDFENGKIRSQKYWIEGTYKVPGNNKTYREFQITKLGCEFLAHKSTGTKGNLFTARYMDRFEEMEKTLKEQNTPSYMIENPVERAKRWILEYQEKEKLVIENQQQTKVIEKQSEVIGEMAPKAEYFDALVDNNLLTNIRDTAKELGIKERTFTEWLIQKNLCYRDKKRKIKPYANKMKYFELKEFTTAWGHSDTQTLITPRGKETFRLLLIKDGLIKDHNKQLELGLPVNEVTKSDFYN